MSNEWEPEAILSASDELSRYVKVFLNGVEQDRCYQARIKWDSFKQPTFGELIVGTQRDDKIAAPIFHMPRLGEFDFEGCWSKFVCGQVRIELKSGHEEAFEQFKAIWS
jgi:hypothetical protein